MRILNYALCSLLVGCGSNTDEMVPTATIYPTPTSYEELLPKLGNDVGWKMKSVDYLQTYEQLGSKGFDKANEFMPWAHVAAALSQDCDRVDSIDISETSSADRLVWFADCLNGSRILVNEQEAQNARNNWPLALDKAKGVAK